MNEHGDQVAVGIGFANCSGLVNIGEVGDFIAKQSKTYSTYGFRLGSSVVAGGLDLYLILQAVAAGATIASILWQAYDRFISSRKHVADDSAGIYVAVQRPDGTIIDVWLGRDAQTKEEFTIKIELIVAEARDPQFRITHEQTIAEIQDSPLWVRLGDETSDQD